MADKLKLNSLDNKISDKVPIINDKLNENIIEKTKPLFDNFLNNKPKNLLFDHNEKGGINQIEMDKKRNKIKLDNENTIIDLMQINKDNM